jgi:hypothetical protein
MSDFPGLFPSGFTIKTLFAFRFSQRMLHVLPTSSSVALKYQPNKHKQFRNNYVKLRKVDESHRHVSVSPCLCVSVRNCGLFRLAHLKQLRKMTDRATRLGSSQNRHARSHRAHGGNNRKHVCSQMSPCLSPLGPGPHYFMINAS